LRDDSAEVCGRRTDVWNHLVNASAWWRNGLMLAMMFQLAVRAEGGERGAILYVAAGGQAKWSGTLADPNEDRSDGPLPSIQAARDTIRRQRSQGNWRDEGVTVWIRGGEYYLTEPLVFGPQDSGRPGGPVSYAAYHDERPAISGGRVITG